MHEHTTYKTEIEPSEVLELFESCGLLARVIDNPRISKTLDGLRLKLETAQAELELLEDEGLKCASSTLIIPEHGQTLYLDKNAGFLFNPSSSEIVHVSDRDSGSSGSGQDFRANESSFESVEDLAEHMRTTPNIHSMNEVNANFTIGSLVGVVVRETISASSLLSGILLHKFIIKHGFKIPLFKYNQDSGALEFFDYTNHYIDELIDNLKIERSKPLYRTAIEELNL